MKKILLILVVAGIAVATLPLWGSCELNAEVCRNWCQARHFNDDMKIAACQARCTSDELSCLARRGTQEVKGLFEDTGK